jgi:hypothetical protein
MKWLKSKFIIWLIIADIISAFILFTCDFVFLLLKLIFVIGVIILNVGLVYYLKNYGEEAFYADFKDNKRMKLWSLLVIVLYVVPLWISFIFD